MAGSDIDKILDWMTITPKTERDSERRKGIKQGFAVAQRSIAKMLRVEGHPDLAKRVERMTIEEKA